MGVHQLFDLSVEPFFGTDKVDRNDDGDKKIDDGTGDRCGDIDGVGQNVIGKEGGNRTFKIQQLFRGPVGYLHSPAVFGGVSRFKLNEIVDIGRGVVDERRNTADGLRNDNGDAERNDDQCQNVAADHGQYPLRFGILHLTEAVFFEIHNEEVHEIGNNKAP